MRPRILYRGNHQYYSGPPRFAIEGKRGASTKKKIRLNGDFKRPEANSLLKLRDASAPNTLDTMFAMDRAFAPSWPSATLMLTIMALVAKRQINAH